MRLAANKSGRKIHDVELNNKYNFYTINKPYFKRNAFFFNPSTSLDDFKRYASPPKKFIAKPNGASLGSGVEIFTILEEKVLTKVYKQLKAKQISYILEDLIIQSEAIGIWNSSSVNSIRINSFLNNNHFSILRPFIRTGRRGSIVDNGGQGGIFASIDKDTGKISTVGMDESGTEYMFHPDSRIEYIGWQVPHWEELLSLTEEIHRQLPKHNYISWDFALTDNGWVLIEGNWGEFVGPQMTYKRGFKKEFLNHLNAK